MIVFLLTCFTVFAANVEFLQLQILQTCALDVYDPKSTLQREFPSRAICAFVKRVKGEK